MYYGWENLSWKLLEIKYMFGIYIWFIFEEVRWESQEESENHFNFVTKSVSVIRIDEIKAKLKATNEDTSKFNSDTVYSYIYCTHNSLTVITCGNMEFKRTT